MYPSHSRYREMQYHNVYSIYMYMYMYTCVWCLWWFHYPGLLLHTELIVSW